MKKKLFSLAVVGICLSLLAGSTWAYFTSSDTAHNVITSGGIGISIVEKTKSGDTLIDFPTEGMTNIMPGSTVSKIVTVENTGEGEAWLRVKVEPAITDAQGEVLPLTIESGGEQIAVMTYTPGENWLDGGDGYYYYATPLAPGASTEVFFDEVRFALEMGNAYQCSTAKLVISAQAVQTANNPKPESGNLSELPGWPEA